MSFNTDAFYDNEIVGYYNGRYIVQDELDELFFLDAPEGLFSIGEVVSPDDLLPINELSFMEIEEVKRIYR